MKLTMNSSMLRNSNRTNVRQLTDMSPTGIIKKESMKLTMNSSKLRRLDSNERPLGYEPNELPLLHSAIYVDIS